MALRTTPELTSGVTREKHGIKVFSFCFLAFYHIDIRSVFDDDYKDYNQQTGNRYC